MINNDATPNHLLNLQITQLTPAMTGAAHQAAAILHHVFAPKGSWETMQEAIEEVQVMLAPERMVWAAVAEAEVIGWIGGVPHYHGNVWELHPLVVKPAWQRQGIGSQLVQHLEQQVKGRGGLTIWLRSDDKHNQTSSGKAYMLIRPAQVTDAPAMGRVMVDTFLTAHRDQMPEEAWQKRKIEWTPDVSARNWARAIAGINDGSNNAECIYVAVTAAGEVVGLAMGHPAAETAQTGEIGSLYVQEQYQGQGIGRQLVQAVAAHLATTGITTLHIAVLAANTPARRFYEAIGGRVVGEREFDEEGFLLPEMVYGWPDIRVLIREPGLSQ